MGVSVTRTVKYILKGDKGDKGDATIIYGVVPSSNYVIIDPNSDNSSTPSYITVKIKQTSGILVTYPNLIPTGFSMWYKNNTDTLWTPVSNNGYVYQEVWDISDYIEIALTSDTNQPSAANVISSITVPFIKSGVNGSDNYLLDLTNEMSAVACDEDGVIDDNAELESTTAFIYKGATLNPGWTYVVSKDGSQVETFTDTTGKGYTFTPTIAMLTSDLNTFDIYATKGSIGTLAAIYTVKKVYSGTPGAPGSAGKNAVLYQINLSADAITIDNNNNAAPSDCVASIKVNNGGVITYLSQPPSGYKMWKKSQVDSSWYDASVDSFIIFQNDWGNTRYGRYINVALTSDPNSPKSDFSNVVDFETLPFIMDGDTGQDGVGISSTVITYQIGSSDTVAPTGTWTTGVPLLIKGQYLWTKTVWNYSDNTSETGYTVSYIANDGNSGEDGLPGKDGVGIVSTTVTYQIGNSGTTAPTGPWSSSVPTAVPGSYLWTKTVWGYSDNTSETGYSVSKYGERGNTGPTLRGPQSWSDCAVGYAFQAGGNSDTWKDVVMYGDNYYSCVKSHTKTSTNYPTSTEDNNNGYWQLGDKIELVATKILLATYALVKNLGVEAIDMKDGSGNILFQAKDGNVICKTGTFENVTIKSEDATHGNSILIDANNGGLKMRGPVAVQDGTNLPQGDARTDLVRFNYETDPDSLTRVGNLELLSGIGVKIRIDPIEGLTYVDGLGNIHYKTWDTIFNT